ncbi:MAG: response regulator [Eubacteriales bacterium]|nr:response regulator [Eubacteriales bacterium]
MYRVMIADDEQIVLRGLKQRIDWKKLDCEVVAAVDDGAEAFRVACELKPDIIITDVKMPGQTGLELIRNLKGILNAAFIIYSAYAEFEFARQALTLETVDYLVKPVNIAKIESTVETAKIRVNKLKYKAVQQDYHNLSTNSSIYRMLDGGVQELDKLSVFSSFAVICIQACTTGKREFDLSALADVLIREETPGKKLMIIRHLKSLNIVCCSVKRDGIYDLLHRTASALQMQQALHRTAFYWGTGEICFEQEKLSDSFEQANAMLEYSSFTQEQMSNTTKFTFQCSGDYGEIIETIVSRLFGGDEELLLEESVNQLFERMLYEHLNVETVRSVVCNLVYSCRYVAEHDYVRVFENRFSKILNISYVMNGRTINELKEWLMGAFHEMRQALQKSTSQSSSDTIKHIYVYIENNISTQITLTDLAEYFNMNPSYISHLFKKETGTNLFDYITLRKMECAKKLLQDDRLLIRDVARMVGYEDQRYFCHVFKKNTGMTAQNFRDKQNILQIRDKNV